MGHINVQLGCSLEQHPLMGFATVTGRRPLTRVEADLDPVDWQPGPNVEMDLIHYDAIKSATSDVGLVGGNNQDEARRFEPRAGPGHRGQKFKLPRAHGRIRLAPLSKARSMTPSRSRKTAGRKAGGFSGMG